MAAATVSLLAAAGGASLLSTRHTAGRDAVRLIGRAARSVPGWHVERSSEAVWETRDLTWGPLYEPHRHPEGAPVGERLLLPTGAYRLELEVEEMAAAMAPPSLVVQVEKPAAVRSAPVESAPGVRRAAFDVRAGEGPVTLRLEGGGPFVVKRIRLGASTFGSGSGLSR